MAKTARFNPYRPNFWGFLIHLIDKGQLYGLLIAFIIIVSVFKMNDKEISDFMKQALQLLDNFHILGGISSAVLVPTSAILYQRQKALYRKNIERLENEIRNESHAN